MFCLPNRVMAEWEKVAPRARVSGGWVSGWPRGGCQGPTPFFRRISEVGQPEPGADQHLSQDLSPRACDFSPLPWPSSTPTVSWPGETQSCCPPLSPCLQRLGPLSGRVPIADCWLVLGKGIPTGVVCFVLCNHCAVNKYWTQDLTPDTINKQHKQ